MPPSPTLARWRYSGKEEQQALSPALFLLDYGARMYDPTLARGLEVQETINDLSYSRTIPIFAAA